jgi:hypothetical protein
MQYQEKDTCARTAAQWETLVGGDWLNKIGMLILVIGIALALGYSFTKIGPAGRVASALAASLAMLAGGVKLEGRERYRIFARGLLGGGWAALYFTVYAMHALAAARVLENGFAAAVLLLAVATGMIAHSLRYRSEALTGLAFAIAFVTLAITDVTAFSVVALAPLAGSLLVVAKRFGWRWCALLGMAATYLTCAWRGDTGAPLWQAQTAFAVYWLLFETFDLLLPDARVLPLNAAGFLGLSLIKWSHAAPEAMWKLLAASAVAYLGSAVLRYWLDMEGERRPGSLQHRWRAAITLAAGLGAGAILMKAVAPWTGIGLLVEAEALYIAGVTLGKPYLRRLATVVFAFQVLQFLNVGLAAPQWRTVAAMSAAFFYLNRALCAEDVFFGYAGMAMLGLTLGYRVPHRDPALALVLASTVPFAIGWRWKLADFRIHGYLLAAAGLARMAIPGEPVHSLVLAAAVAYGGALCACFSKAERFLEDEPFALRLNGAVVAAILLMAALWRALAYPYRGAAWMALALVLLELGMRNAPRELRRLAYCVAALGGMLVVYYNLFAMTGFGPPPARWMPAVAAAAAYAIAGRAHREEDGRVLVLASLCGTGFAMAAFWALLPEDAAGAGWAVLALGLAIAGRLARREELEWQGHWVALVAFAHVCFTLGPIPPAATAVACFYAAQQLQARGTGPRLYYSLLGTILLTALLFDRVSGGMLTVAWGTQGLALLAAGFPLRDRVLRLSGLGLLAVCILKLFVYDLRFLHPQAFRLRPAVSGYAAADPLVYCAGSDSGGGLVDLHAFPGAGGAVLVGGVKHSRVQ